MSVEDLRVRHNAQWKSACDDGIYLYDQTTSDFKRIQRGSFVRVNGQWEEVSCCACPTGYTYNSSLEQCTAGFNVTGETKVFVVYDTSSMSSSVITSARNTINEWALSKGIQDNTRHILDGMEDWITWLTKLAFNDSDLFQHAARFPLSSTNLWQNTYNMPDQLVNPFSTLISTYLSRGTQNNNFIVIHLIDEAASRYHKFSTEPVTIDALRGPSFTADLDTVFNVNIKNEIDKLTYASIVYPVSSITNFASQTRHFRAHVLYTIEGSLNQNLVNQYSLGNPALQNYLDDYIGLDPYPSRGRLKELGYKTRLDREDSTSFVGGLSSDIAEDLDILLASAAAADLPQDVVCGTACVCPVGFFVHPTLPGICVQQTNPNNQIPCSATIE